MFALFLLFVCTCQNYIAVCCIYDNTGWLWLWSRTAGLETVCCVWASHTRHSVSFESCGADRLWFNWESAGLCRRAVGMCIVKPYFSFVLMKCWCKGRGSEKLKDWERGGRGGGKKRGRKELDCIIDYPITSTALRNYPFPRQPDTHIQSASRAADSCSAAHRGRRVALGGEKKDGQVTG